MKRSLVIMALAAFALAAAGEDFTWTGGSTVRLYTDTTYWSSSTPDTLPGEDDYFFHGSGYYRFDLGGSTHTIGGVTNGYAQPFSVQNMSVENGTLVIKHSFSNRLFKVTVKNTGHFMLGPDSSSELGDGGGGCNYFYVKNGGELTMKGETIAARFIVDVESGGTLTFDPSSFFFLSGTYDIAVQAITNSGSAYFPNGITLAGDCHKTKPPSDFTLYQKAGTMTLGGSVVRDGERGLFYFVLAGGTVAATADVAFSGLDAVTMADNATATINVASAKTFDFAEMSFGSGTAIVKTGDGTIAFATAVPAAVTVQAGSLLFNDAATLGTLALSPQTKVVFAHSGVTVTSASGYAGADFIVDAGVLGAGVPLLNSPDASFLAAVAAKLELPAGYVAQVSGQTLTIQQDESVFNVFTSSGEQPLGTLACWNTESVPEGEDVYVSGAATVAVLDQSAPSFKSITVVNGATLKVTGSVSSLPPVALQYDSRILFAEDTAVTLEDGDITAVASADHVPVFEVATNAVLDVGTSYKFINVDFRLYGVLAVNGDVWLGWAGFGETTYFKMAVDGGTFSNNFANGSFRFVCPEAGGTVSVPDKMTVRAASFMPTLQKYFKTHVGWNNNVNAPFTLEVDGCNFEMRGSGEMHIGGAATISCINGGSLYKPPAWSSPGNYNRIYLEDRARLVFDGSSSVILSHSRHPGLQLLPQEDGYGQMTFRNGSYMAIHDTSGNGKSVATFEDSFVDVMQYCKLDTTFAPKITDPRMWATNAFCGMKQVVVPEGKFLGIRSVDYWRWGTNLNRVVTLDPLVPITGGGSLFVTNASPGWSMQAIVACGSNTATGEAWACPSADGCQLVFDDGSNWAGTLVATEDIAFTNRTSGASPATAEFGAVRFAGRLRPRVWRAGAEPASDYLRIKGSLSGTGGILPIAMDGEPVFGDTYTIGEIPLVNGEAPDVSAYATREWKLTAVPSGDGETALLNVRYAPPGTRMIIR